MSTTDKPDTRAEIKAAKTTAAKAYVGAGIAAAVAGASNLYTALDDGVVTSQEWVGISVAVLVSLGAVFGGVYSTTNKAR